MDKHAHKISKFFILFLILLSACSSDSKNSNSHISTLPPNVNIEPLNIVYERESVILIAKINDDSGDIKGINWEQTSGPQVSIENINSERLKFDTPEVTEDLDLTFKVTVTDVDNNTASDQLTVTVKPIDLIDIDKYLTDTRLSECLNEMAIEFHLATVDEIKILNCPPKLVLEGEASSYYVFINETNGIDRLTSLEQVELGLFNRWGENSVDISFSDEAPISTLKLTGNVGALTFNNENLTSFSQNSYQVTPLDLSSSNTLTNLSLHSENSIELVLASNAQVKSVVTNRKEVLTALNGEQTNHLHLKKIDDINLERFDDIKELLVDESNIASLNLTNQKHLETLEIYRGYQLNQIMGLQETAINSLSLDWTQLTQLDLTLNQNLHTIFLEYNYKLQELKLPESGLLESFTVKRCNLLTSLNISEQTQLSILLLEDNKLLNSIVLPYSNTLTKLHLKGNNIVDINLETLPNIEFIDLRDNPLSTSTKNYIQQLSANGVNVLL